ncbi:MULTISPECIES: endopeptidase La [Methylorubrum]|mgnify:CR=1 FL=1|jgi:ATP-dependent Lon protease|uniref:Lon protease n=6 Tax=Methylorubrum extorquens TaxID=408 RepID=C5AR94_METEA|nr:MULTISPECIES: endopeptidase La [Methylobacteriaceae]KQO86758.1 DNA-binding protein [Methylobacterium sp. Leaf90]KQO94910.1 DNA-binding protein [Methylobacterium sp. Leaf92]KQP87546.1 DNA-binding protein [Methylobacterium sp. Leaf119]MBA9066544.1 ATP-dependent Lon protease [Methylobacterium sp. RAS18]MDF9865330.1 ATP-dependent Lon protease [Methylorubrum pseudosasae]MDH6638897.1 ATP-dependent Lon protease [Methylobacterium sp. SuP10 SLI 274]
MTQSKSRQPVVPGSTGSYAVLPLRDIVVFPHMIVPLFVGREKSIRALEEAVRSDRHILLATQINASDDDPATDAIYTIGTLASVLQLLKLPDGTVKVLVEGAGRAQIESFVRSDEYYEAQALTLTDDLGDRVEAEALARSVISEFENYVKLNKKISPEVVSAVTQIDEPSKLADTVGSHLAVKIADKQAILEIPTVAQRLERVLSLMESEISVLQVEKRIRTRVKRQMEKTQREYYLNEQMKAIQKELGDEDGRDELAELEDKIEKTKLTKEAREKATAELKKLRQMSPMSAEATVVRNYLDWMLGIPWGKRSKIKKDLLGAQQVLDSDHFGLDKVKDRIVEYLAVQQRANKLTGPILCLVGPPGVGKTSLGKSIAKATGREFVRMSLGGVRDEAEIRGHRRTYIGSMPGKIVQSMRKAKTSNPLILLDEIDKMGMDFRGDPSAALLEVLDPEQNATFNDHYLEVDYDLSNVMFVTTANTLNIPGPLMDRMEVIRIAGYTEEEKLQIARRHLIPEAVKKHGLTPDEWSITDDGLMMLIRRYTREAGVRNLEREISNLIRKAVKEILITKVKQVEANPETLPEFLGPPKFRYGEIDADDQVGVVTGLAWTEVGGELLTIEGVMMPGKGKMTVTGNLRDVMKESISAAASYVRSRAIDFGIEPPLFERRDIHVHVPEGATPKDGPSAGIAMATAIISTLTGIPVRRDVAMTGEVTLRGRVLPIGGLKEKLLAALRGGIKTVMIPEENAKDIAEVPDSVKNGLEIIPVSRMDQVLQHALVRQPEPIEWDEPLPAKTPKRDEDGAAVIAH